MLSYMLTVTGQENYFYIGHSMVRSGRESYLTDLVPAAGDADVLHGLQQRGLGVQQGEADGGAGAAHRHPPPHEVTLVHRDVGCDVLQPAVPAAGHLGAGTGLDTAGPGGQVGPHLLH